MQNKTFRTPDDDIDTSKPKYYVLDMFPYPRFLFTLTFLELITNCYVIVFFVRRKKAAFFFFFFPLSEVWLISEVMLIGSLLKWKKLMLCDKFYSGLAACSTKCRAY